jgi:hypothetical protein
MPEDKTISDSSWTEKEDLLLRELLHHAQPGGLNQQDELSWPPELTWPEIVIRMNELASVPNSQSDWPNLGGLMRASLNRQSGWLAETGLTGANQD